MKAILLAGGTGSRLYPTTISTNKHSLLVFDKPMFYYPLSVLILLGVKEILVISNTSGIKSIKEVIKQRNIEKINSIKIRYKIQNRPNGIPEAFLIASNFLKKKENCILILGDNFFYSTNIVKDLDMNLKINKGSKVFLYKVADPQNFGSINFNRSKNKIKSLVEKPKNPENNYAVTGLYLFDGNVVDYAKKLKKSKRNELEITDLLNVYLKKKKLDFQILSRGYTWFDMGTFDNLLDVQNFVKIIQQRQGFSIGDIENLSK